MDQTGLQGLKANEKNPRFMSKFDADNLKQSMQEFGDLSGIVFNTKTGQLVGGHQRIETFKRMDETKQIVIDFRFDMPNSVGTTAVGHILYKDERYGYREVEWDLDREYAANIAANRISGEFDLDKLAEMDWWLKENNPDLLALTGQSDEEISKLLDGVGPSEGEEDEAPEVDEVNPPVSKLGEIYQLGRHRLMCGSATDLEQVKALMAGKMADMIFTDPPYGVDYEGINNDDRKGLSDLLEGAFENYAAVSRPGSSFYCFHSDKCADIFHDIYRKFCHFSSMIIWVKPSLVMGQSDFHSKHEPMLYGWLEGDNHKWYGDRSQTSIWEFGKEQAEGHTTPKPTELIIHALQLSSIQGQLVVDFFGGSGSTLLAAEKAQRTCNTMELDPKYVDVIRKRYWKHVNNGDETGWEAGTPAIAQEAVAA